MSSSAERLMLTPADWKSRLAFLLRPTFTINGMDRAPFVKGLTTPEKRTTPPVRAGSERAKALHAY